MAWPNTFATSTGARPGADLDENFSALENTASTTEGDALVGVKRTATSAAATTLHSWVERQPINAMADFGCVADGVANDTTALQAALTAAIAQKRSLYLPGGTYLLTGAAGADSYANGLLVPFGTVNADPADSVLIYGDAGLTRLKCNANNMILLRIARNCVTVRDLVLDSNSKTGVILCGIVPESTTQTTTLVSQSCVTLLNVDRIGGAGAEGIVFQPGPQVLGADSGCFYHNVIGGLSNFVGGGRHVYVKKNADWATHPNRTTRTNFIGQRFLRGNTGYHFEVGSEIALIGCNEEIITSGTTPNTSPTARYVGDDVSGRITYWGGYTEACTTSTRTPTGDKVRSYGYSFNSAPDVNEWNARATAYDDDLGLSGTLALTVVSSGGGSAGAGSATCRYRKQGRLVWVSIEVDVLVGTLAAGSLSLSGMPFVPSVSGQRIPGGAWSLITTTGTQINGLLSSTNVLLRKSGNGGGSDANLALSEIGTSLQVTLQGVYEV